MFSWYYIEGILIQSCYTLLIVLGLSILTGYTGMFSFGHAGFVCIGAYVSILCTMAFGLPYWLSLIIAGLAAMLLGAGLGKITLNLKGDYFCIATLGVGEAIRLIFNNLQLTINVGGKDFLLDGAKGVASIPLHTTFKGSLVIVVIFLTATALLMNSKHGRSMLAVREDELAAQMSGINTFRSKMLAMCMSALYAGIAGGMMAHYFGYLQPKMFLMTKSTEYTIMVIFGGMGSITGSVLGTAVLLDGIAARIEEELGRPATLVVTGGLAKYVTPLCRHPLAYDPELLMKGLALLYQLNAPQVQRIILSGRYCNDLAERFSFTDIPREKVTVQADIPAAAAELKADGSENVYVVTCFSDRDKILSQVVKEA